MKEMSTNIDMNGNYLIAFDRCSDALKLSIKLSLS